MEQQFTATDRALGISLCLLQQLSADILFCHRLAFHKLLKFLQVLRRIEYNTLSFATITASTTCLLIISLQTLRNIVMYYEAYIRFVDTHTKGDGSNNNINTLHQEVVLGL